MADFPEHGLYCITDSTLGGGLSHVEQARRCLEGGARIVQLRDKRAEGADAGGSPGERFDALLAAAREIAGLCHDRGALLIVNDDPRLAAESGADGVHVGQDDVAVEEARRIVGPEAIVGLSMHTREQILSAGERPIDYLGFGPVFHTGTKILDYGPLGVPEVRWAVHHSALPVVPIGGIDADNLPSLVAVGARFAAVISAVIASPDIAAAAREMAGMFE